MTTCLQCRREIVQPIMGRKRKYCDLKCKKRHERSGQRRPLLTNERRAEALRAWR